MSDKPGKPLIEVLDELDPPQEGDVTDVDWREKVMQHPAWKDFYERETGRQQRMESVRAAFIAARKKA